MSRCFPFPPPGYEPKARTGIIDLLTKEKYREKKHKKEKRDKEKRERKEKRNKDRSKDKPKEKKDQKHKDKNKEKDRDKGKTSEDIKAEGHNELHIKESWRKTDETKGSKLFEEELGKRTRDYGAENPMVGNLTNSIPRKLEAVQRRNDDSGRLPIENVSISQRRAECVIPATSKQKERNKMLGCVLSANLLEKETSKIHEKVAVAGRRGTEESRNHGISQSGESVSGLAIWKTEGFRAGVEKGKCGERSLVSNSVVPGLQRGKLGAKISASSTLAAAQRKDSVLTTEPVSPTSLPSSLDGMDSVLTIEKGRATGGEMFRVGRAAENLIHKKVEGKNKTQGKQAEGRKGLKDTNHSVKKSKAKDKDILTKEKKKEENAEGVEHNNFKNFGKKDQTSHKDNAIGTVFIDGTLKKRKHAYTNGYLQENDERPDKIPSMTSSSQSLVKSSPASGELSKNSDVSLAFLPHPDSKYLSQIYAIPKTTESLEIDGHDWLFDCYDTLRKSEIELKAEKIPLVFDEALRIESADVLALPYVVPF